MRSFLQLVNDIFVQLREIKGTDIFWSESEVKDALNDVYTEIADELMCFNRDAIIELKAGIRTYKLPEDHILGSLRRVEFNEMEIWPVTVAELDMWARSWRTESADPTHYIVDLYASDEIPLYPKPATDGNTYSLASESQDYGVITTIGDTSYEDFDSEEGVITTSSGEVRFDESEGFGPVLAIEDPTNNLHIFDAKYPKRLSRDSEVFLHPVTYNPRKVLTKGTLAILLSKEGEGKDILKSTYWRNSFLKSLRKLTRPKVKRIHTMRSISNISIGGRLGRGRLNVGSNYPTYYR